MFFALFFGSLAGVCPVMLCYHKNLASLVIFPVITLFSIYLTFLGYQLFRRSDDVILTSDDGIDIQSPNRSCLIGWNELSEIRYRGILQWIELYSRTGEHIVNIDYQLDDFEKLCRLISFQVRHLYVDNQKEYASSGYTHLRYIVFIVSFSMMAVTSTLSGLRGTWIVMSASIAFAAIFMLAYL